jgi:hypothetical protein
MKNCLIESARHFCFIACSLAVGSTAALAQDICDPSKPVASDPWDRYHERNSNRCEGVYGEQPVSGDIIGDIASFTLGKPLYELKTTPLTLEWPTEVEGPVHLRAVALREDLLYQMDAVGSAGASSFEWPTDLLVHRSIEPDELGVRAWVVETLLQHPRALHLPLSVRQGALVPEAQRYWLVIMPGAPLRKLEVGLDLLNTADEVSAEQPGEAEMKLEEVTPYRSLGQGYYAARRAVRIALPVLAQPGNYRLRVRAERDSDGELDTESFWFAHVVP